MVEVEQFKNQQKAEKCICLIDWLNIKNDKYPIDKPIIRLIYWIFNYFTFYCGALKAE